MFSFLGIESFTRRNQKIKEKRNNKIKRKHKHTKVAGFGLKSELTIIMATNVY